jgi:hypothetical protein
MPLQIVNETLPERVKLFIDSDGVFADFDARCESIFGKEVPVKKGKEFWDRFMAEGGFAELTLMPYAQELARQVLDIPGAKILTGTPRAPHDEAAALQKREWYARNFNIDPDRIICCMSYMKPAYAAKAVKEGFIPILIDDKIKARDGWEAEGGIFIHYPRPHHVSAVAGCAQTLKLLATFAQEFKSSLEGELGERVWELAKEDAWGRAKRIGISDLKVEAETQLREAATLRDLGRPLVTGKDLMALGFKPGPLLGKALKATKEAQAAGNRDKSSLIEIARGVGSL